MNNQDIDGNLPPEAAAGAAAADGAPGTLEQQLEKEREARALMRDRLRHTEALAAESHALRAGMAQELERVTADRDRLRAEAAAAKSSTSSASSTTAVPLFTPTMAPPTTPHVSDRPLKPPPPPSRKGPWGALAMLGVVAVGVAAVAWYEGSLPRERPSQVTAAATATAPVAVTPPAASATVATAAPSNGAVALPPLSPEVQLATAPTAAGPAAPATPAGMPDRLRKALDGEGIASSVDVDAASGHVTVADPQADDALRQRTDLVIRAVYAGASLPEPQIEHRWLSPRRGDHGAQTAQASTDAVQATPAVAPVVRHAAEHRKTTAADGDELRPVLPSGRITASCMEGLAGKSTARRASMTACMKRSCTSSAAAHNSEECRAYDKAYPFSTSG